MAYAKPPKRSELEWKAYANWVKNPVEAVKDWFKVTPDDWQGDMLNAIFKEGHDRGVVKSAHGVGKTAFDAWAGWIFLNCFENSRLVATAPTQAQLSDALFPEFGLWHSKMPEKMQNEWIISTQHIRHKGNPNVWFGVARTSNKPANLQGFHNKAIFIIADEGSAVPDPVYEVIEGALSEATDEDDARIISKSASRS
jgi:phage terminase large subunit